ncbi:MAG: phosphoribosylamine--glycine ligase [Alphaproteobacteria bacterium]|nr:phosphoribosylamine--glycine ligase [Alphaproteobacteria bacterium]
MADALTILLVGGGGREHALSRSLAASPRCARLLVAPGNGGTESDCHVTNVDAISTEALLALVSAEGVGLVVVGPEAPLAEGLADQLAALGVPCFGPSKAGARLEASKAWAKEFMARHGIPTARGAAFTEAEAARAFFRDLDHDVVIKASGLAAGKGVVVCDDADQALAAIEQILEKGAFGAAGETLIVEERLSGPEVSLLAFVDGERMAIMPAAQDHKRAGEGDTGPNTGGMGAYAPAPVLTPELLERARREVLEPTLAGLKAEGIDYRGVLYAGLMLTEDGPKVLEFNCRFGDPETQVLLPLLESDLVEIALACAAGALDPEAVTWRAGSAATVVLASAGYPGAYQKGQMITGTNAAEQVAGVQVFHAGTRLVEGELETSGGRVLAVTGVGEDLASALERAYEGVHHIRFEGAWHRGDIGARALPAKGMSYRDAGVDIAAGSKAVSMMKAAVEATHGPRVLGGLGAFGGLFDVQGIGEKPVLVASTDGVGTKTKIASAMGRYDTVGRDIVNHCVNDILVQGARPLFFLDYVAASRLDPQMVADVVGSAAAACAENGAALLGGETAEMPGVYTPGEFDLVGTIIGVVERDRLIDGGRVQVGDAVLGLASSGLHTNGFSLARRVFEGWDLAATPEGLGRPLGEALIEPHRSYLREVEALWDADVDVRGLAHITGGGLIDNPPRVLPAGRAMHIDTRSWPLPPLFQLIQRAGGVAFEEMLHVFNMGLGMLVVMPAEQLEAAQAALAGKVDCWPVGHIIERGEGPAVVFG